MVRVREEAHTTGLRVFNWNEKLVNRGVKRRGLSVWEGLFLFRITDRFTTTIPGEGVVDVTVRTTDKLVRFENTRLLSRASIQNLSRAAVIAADQFLTETIPSLGVEISNRLLGCYPFDPDMLTRPLLPRIVIFVEVSRSRSVEYRSREETMEMKIMGVTADLFPPWCVGHYDTLFFWEPGDLFGPEPGEEEYDSDEFENDPSLDYEEDVFDILCTLKYWLGLKNYCPIEPIVVGEPLGLVEVLPVSVQVALETVEEQHGDLVVPIGTCPICLGEFSSAGRGMEHTRTPCSHIFHTLCITQWLPRNRSCPVCRSALP